MKRIIALVLALCLLAPQVLTIGAEAAQLLVSSQTDIGDPALPDRDVTGDEYTLKPGSGLSAMATSSSNPVYVEGELLYSYAFEALDLINADRVTNGLSELVMSSGLLSTAVQRSAEQTVYFGTTRPDGTSGTSAFPSYSYTVQIRERVLGNTTVARVAEKMLEQIDLYAKYNTVGISCFRHNGILYWALDFCTATASSSAAQPADAVKMMQINLGAEYYTAGIYAETSMDIGESQEMEMYLENPEWTGTYAFLDPDHTTFASADTAIATVAGNVLTAVASGETEITATSGNQNGTMTLSVRMDDCNHQWGPGETTVLATCTSDGEYTYSCTVCGQVQRDVIPAWDHYYLDERCTNCGDNTREDGTELYPYNIESAEEFQRIADDPGVCYKLMADLTLSDGFQIPVFSGTLDGNGYSLTLTGNQALIDYIPETGTVKNLTVEVKFELDQDDIYEIGTICLTNCGLIENCVVNGSIDDEFTDDILNYVAVGGICAQNYGRITKCKNDADLRLQGGDLDGLHILSAPAYIGGVVGINRGKVDTCWNDGYITVYLADTSDTGVPGAGYIGGIVGTGHADNCATGADMDVRFYSDYTNYPVYAGYIHGEENFAIDSSCYVALSINDCMVSENSALSIQYVYGGYPYTHSIAIDSTSHEEVTNQEIEEWWARRFDPIPEPEGIVRTSVRYFSSWDAEGQIARFGSSDTQSSLSSLVINYGSAVSDKTAPYFLNHVDSLVNTYCLVSTRSRTDGKVGPDELLTVIPVETSVGTITAVEDGLLYINQIAYLYDPELISYPEWYDDCYVRYHLLNGQVVGLWLLTQPADTEVIEKVTASGGGASMIIRPFVLDAGGIDKWFEESVENVTLTTVNNDNIGYLEDGFVIPMKDARTGDLTLSRKGYRDYIIPSRVSRGLLPDESSKSLTTVSAYMQEDRGDGKPYVSTVFIRSGSSGFADARFEDTKLKEDVVYSIVATAVGLGDQDVTFYLAQNAVNQVPFENGLLVDTLYDKFDFSDDIYIYAVAEDGTMTRPEKVKIEKHVEMNDDVADLLSSGDLHLLSSDGKGFKINNEIPLIGGLNINMNAFDSPIGVEVDGNTVKITIGVDIFSSVKRESENENDDKEDVDIEPPVEEIEDKYNYYKLEYEKNEIEKEEMDFAFSKFKNMLSGKNSSASGDQDEDSDDGLKDLEKQFLEFDAILDFYERCEDMFPGSVTKLYNTKDKAFNVGAIGYMEAVILDGQLVIKECSFVLQGDIRYKYTQQGAIWAVPAYFYVEGSGDLDVTLGAEAQLVGGDMPMDFGIKLDVTPGVGIGAGVGIADAASVGIRGEGSLPYHHNFSKKYHRLEFDASFSVEAKFFILEGSKTLLETEDPLTIFDNYYGSSASANALSAADRALRTETAINVVSRDYADDTSRWMGSRQQAQQMGVEDVAHAGVTFQTLQSSVFDRSQPQLVDLGTKMLMVWVEDAEDRDDYNRMRLVYSVYNSLTDTWSAGQPVWDDGHNDGYPALVTDGTNTYVAWQKINKTLTAEDCTSLDATLENSEIFMATFDGTAFTDVRQLTDNQVYDYAPAISIVNGQPQVYYVTSAGNDLQAAGSHTLMCGTQVVAEKLNYVLATMAQGSRMALLMDADGDVTTTDDINIYTLSGTTLTAFDKAGSDRAYTGAGWSTLDGAETLFVTDGINIYYMADGERRAVLEDDRQIGGNFNATAFADGTMLLWTEDTDGTNEVFSVSFTDGVWTKPVQVSAHGVRITGLDTVSHNGKVVGVCNTAQMTYDESLKEYQPLQTDLCVFRTNDFSDLVMLDQVTFLESAAVPGSASPITVLLENDGTTHIDQVTFTLTDTLGTSTAVTADVDLLPGDTQPVTLDYPVPAAYAAATLTIRADIAGTDIDPDNNTVSLPVGRTDLSIREAKIFNEGSVYVLRTVVDNLSAIDAEGVTLSVCMDEAGAAPLQTDVIGAIPSGSYATAELRLDESLLTFDETGAARIFIQAATTSPELNITNNASFFAVSPLVHGTCAHLIAEDVAAKAPTCVMEGYTAGRICAGCGAELAPTDRVAPTGHDYVYTVTLEPTLTDCGILMGRCTHCFGMNFQILPALSEVSYTRQVIRDATAAQPGIARYTWKVTDYGVYYFDVEIPLATAQSSIVDVYGIRWYSMAFEVLELTNEARAEQGLQPLTMTASLLESAMLRSEELSVYYSHTRPDGSDCFTAFPADVYGMVAENVAANYDTAAEVVTGWLNSPGHYENMMDPDMTTIGVGSFYHNGVIYWSQCFAQSSGTACTQPSDTYYTSHIELGSVKYDLLLNGETQMTVGDSQELLAGIFNPGFTSACTIFENNSLTWASGDPTIASVENGVVTAHAAGTVTIWAYTGANSASITLEILPGASQVTFTSASISLAGDIGINFYAQFSDDIIADEGAYMAFTIAGKTHTVPLSQATLENGSYRFSCAVNAKQMTDVVTAQMYTSAGPVGSAKTYSVKEYADRLFAYIESTGTTAFDSVVPLVKAMLNYGAYSQICFGYNTDDLANADLAAADKTLPDSIDVSAFAHSISGSEEGIQVYSASLLLESETTARFYFRLTGSKTIDEYTFIVDGQTVTPTPSGDGIYYVDKTNISAKDLDTAYVASVGGLSVTYYGLSYVRSMLSWSGSTEALINIAKSLYVYNQAANTYFGA